MSTCRRCGAAISSQYLYCYDCNKLAKTYKDEKGYVRFKDTDTPIHRYVAEKKLGRELRPGEVVHHYNRDKTDNRKSNLSVLPSQKAHDRIHKIDAARFGKQASYQGFKKKRRGGKRYTNFMASCTSRELSSPNRIEWAQYGHIWHAGCEVCRLCMVRSGRKVRA